LGRCRSNAVAAVNTAVNTAIAIIITAAITASVITAVTTAAPVAAGGRRRLVLSASTAGTACGTEWKANI